MRFSLEAQPDFLVVTKHYEEDFYDSRNSGSSRERVEITRLSALRRESARSDGRTRPVSTQANLHSLNISAQMPSVRCRDLNTDSGSPFSGISVSKPAVYLPLAFR